MLDHKLYPQSISKYGVMNVEDNNARDYGWLIRLDIDCWHEKIG